MPLASDPSANWSPTAEAVQRRFKIDWNTVADRRSLISRERALLPAIPLEQIVPFIDWSPFFMSWELKGKYPKIFDDPKLGPRARELFDDAQKLLGQIVVDKRVTANAVYGFFPANTEGDDIVIYTDESRAERADAVPHAPAAMGARRPDLVPIAGRLRGPARDGHRRLPGGVRRHGRTRARVARRAIRTRSRRLQRDHEQGTGRPARRGPGRNACTRRPVKTGATAATST